MLLFVQLNMIYDAIIIHLYSGSSQISSIKYIHINISQAFETNIKS